MRHPGWFREYVRSLSPITFNTLSQGVCETKGTIGRDTGLYVSTPTLIHGLENAQYSLS